MADEREPPGPPPPPASPEPPVEGLEPSVAPVAAADLADPDAPAAPAGRRAAAAAKAQATAARVGGGVDRGLTRAQPVLGVASKALGGLGRLVVGASIVGAAGAALLLVLGLRDFGWSGLIFGLAGLAPLAGWRVGRRAIRGAGLLGDPRRVLAAVKASGQAGREWLDHLAAFGGAAKARKVGGVARSAVGAGRALWRAVGPEVEGAEDLKALALWPRTVAMTVAGLLSPLLLLLAAIWALVSLAL